MRRPTPLRLVVLSLALVLAACSENLIDTVLPTDTDAPAPGGPGTDGSEPAGSPDPGQVPPGGGNGGPTSGNGGNGSGGNGGGPNSPTDPGPNTLTPVNDSGGLGAHGPAMLRDDRSRIILEIDVQQGAAVDNAAVGHLVAIIEQYSGKDVVQSGGNTFSSSEEQWTTEKLRNAVAANRSTASTSDAVSIHLLYVRGGLFRDGEETSSIGVAYGASQMAVFPDRWAGLGGLVGSDRAIERAVLVHEWGHLLGLVNLTYTSEIDHEDPEHPGHSDNRNSVMFWQVETDLIGQLLGSIPDDFDSADRADMQQIADGG